MENTNILLPIVDQIVPVEFHNQLSYFIPPRWIPAGFEVLQGYLLNASAFNVEHIQNIPGMILGINTINRYIVRDQQGIAIFYVVEETDCCNLYCTLGHARPFIVRVIDIQTGRNLLQFSQSSECQDICCFCCLQDMQVVSADGACTLGSVVQQPTFFKPNLHIKDASNTTILKIKGNAFPNLRFSDSKFQILATNGVQIGTITRLWKGFMREVFTNEVFHSINFPADLDINVKAMCLSAVFLIDFMYFTLN